MSVSVDTGFNMTQNINKKLLALVVLCFFTTLVLSHIIATFMVHQDNEEYKIKYAHAKALLDCKQDNSCIIQDGVIEAPKEYFEKYYSEEDKWYDYYLNLGGNN